MGRARSLDEATVARGAAKLVRERGADALTVRNLAEALHLSPAGLYRYYPSIEAIEAAARRFVLDQLVASAGTPTFDGLLELAARGIEAEPVLSAWVLHPDEDWSVLAALCQDLRIEGVDGGPLDTRLALDNIAAWSHYLCSTSAEICSRDLRAHGTALARWSARIQGQDPRSDLDEDQARLAQQLDDMLGRIPSGPPRTASGDRTEEIVRAMAIALFRPDGRRPTMRELAASLGMGVGQLYAHVDQRQLEHALQKLLAEQATTLLWPEGPTGSADAWSMARLSRAVAMLAERFPLLGDELYQKPQAGRTELEVLIRTNLEARYGTRLTVPADVVVSYCFGSLIRRWRMRAIDPAGWADVPAWCVRVAAGLEEA